MLVRAIVVSCLLVVCMADDCFEGGGMKDFDLQKYLENPRWYVAFVNPVEPEKVFLQEYDCISLDLKMEGDEVTGVFRGLNKETNEVKTLDYRAINKGAVFSTLEGSLDDAVDTIMDTDYDNWVLGRTCIKLEDENFGIHWALTRSPEGSLGDNAPRQLMNLPNYPGWKDLANCTFA